MGNVVTEEFRVMVTYCWGKQTARIDLLRGDPAGSINYTLKPHNIHS
jgi:hypothetical protein